MAPCQDCPLARDPQQDFADSRFSLTHAITDHTKTMMKIKSKDKHRLMTSVISYFTTSLTLSVVITSVLPTQVWATEDIEFNTDVLDLADRNNIDISVFSQRGYIMPGRYPLHINLNQNLYPVIYDIDFFQPEADYEKPIPCITPDIFATFNMRSEWHRKARWLNEGACLDLHSIPGMTTDVALAKDSLMLTVPQAYLEYSAPDWDPPSRWDNGMSGVIFDYNLNTQRYKPHDSKSEQQINGNGIVGVNLGAWRLRADWQASYRSNDSQNRDWRWSRYYAYRALPQLGAKLVLGENYLTSDIFDSFRFMGAGLTSEDSMLPPNLRGYAPEVTGIAKTNAVVTIKQMGRVIYQTQVAPGPFRIQDLNDFVKGKLDVVVEEQDGSTQEFQVDTASIPYLTRPGRVRYKVAMGKPNQMDHKNTGPGFGMGEFSWGVNNGWSLYGGAIGANDYHALALGVGRDLLMFGALSFDITRSRADLPNEGKVYRGHSYRISYSKTFEQYNSQIAFAGYRFSEADFMNMEQYISRRYRGEESHNSKEMYTVSFSKQFTDLGLSSYLSYSHETYWNRPTREYYNLSLSKYITIGQVKNIGANLSAFRNQYNETTDDGVYLNFSVPLGDSGYISYHNMFVKGGNAHTVSYYDRLNERTTYNVGAGTDIKGKPKVNAYITNQNDYNTLTVSASHVNDNYTSLGLSLQGGITSTLQGVAAHRTNTLGGSRVFIDTRGVEDIPLRSFGNTTKTNAFGKAIITDVNDYYRNTLKVDVDKLPEKAEVISSVQQITLTEGAIGYRQFDVLTGFKLMVNLTLDEGTPVPFGASVKTRLNRHAGIVGDNGNVYLSGINAGDTLDVIWNDRKQCQVTIANDLQENDFTIMPLQCSTTHVPVSPLNHLE